MTVVTVLCAAVNSAYIGLPGVEIFDKKRDARSWRGGSPVVAHPPCRAWSVHTSHQAKPEPGEKELGVWCVGQVKQWGGVLEHPAHSRLWEECKLPKPHWKHRGDLWTMEVSQAWWGYPMLKKTWLLMVGINPNDVYLPLVLHPRGGDRRKEQLMSHKERSATMPQFAKWLVETARHSHRILDVSKENTEKEL